MRLVKSKEHAIDNIALNDNKDDCNVPIYNHFSALVNNFLKNMI